LDRGGYPTQDHNRQEQQHATTFAAMPGRSLVRPIRYVAGESIHSTRPLARRQILAAARRGPAPFPPGTYMDDAKSARQAEDGTTTPSTPLRLSKAAPAARGQQR